MSENIHEQAEAAIDSLGGLDAALQDGGTAQPLTPESQTVRNPNIGTTPGTDAQQAHWQQTPRDDAGRWTAEQQQAAQELANAQEQQQTQQAGDTSFMGENFDPNSLPPELVPAYRQMQAHWTRKNQEAAALQQQFTQFGDVEDVRAAMELRETLADPRNWPALHAELSDNLQQMGLSPAQAAAEASRQMAEQTAPITPDLTQFDDPELAPLKQYVDSLKGQLDSVQTEFSQWREAQEQQQIEMALVGEITRQVNAIRQSNPHYTDADIDAIYEIGSYYDGDLVQAQQRYEAMVTDRLSRYVQSKQKPNDLSGAFSGAGTTSTVPRTPTDLGEARAAALQFAAQMDSQQ